MSLSTDAILQHLSKEKVTQKAQKTVKTDLENIHGKVGRNIAMRRLHEKYCKKKGIEPHFPPLTIAIDKK